MADATSCANPSCTCVSPPTEKFCSEHCKEVKDEVPNAVEVICRCGHPGCGRAALEL